MTKRRPYLFEEPSLDAEDMTRQQLTTSLRCNGYPLSTSELVSVQQPAQRSICSGNLSLATLHRTPGMM